MIELLADRIRKARRVAGLSQAQAAKILAVHRGTFGHWERGAGHVPSSANLMSLAVLMAVPYEWLATGRGAMQLSSDDVPVVRLDCVALSEDEEQLLLAFRNLPWQRRKAILYDVCSGPTAQVVQPVSAAPARPPTWNAGLPTRKFG